LNIKPKFSKWRLAVQARSVEKIREIDKKIREIKINSVPKNTKVLCKNTKTIMVIIGEYSPRLRLGE
jgi:transcription elongation factor GreA-like protein